MTITGTLMGQYIHTGKPHRFQLPPAFLPLLPPNKPVDFIPLSIKI